MNHNSVLVGIGAHSDAVHWLEGSARWGESHPSRVTKSVGGCAFNVAAALSRAGQRVVHAGLRGHDTSGNEIKRALERHGIVDAGLVLPEQSTGEYTAFVEPGGDLAMASAAMSIYGEAGRLASHEPYRDAAQQVGAMVLDANADANTIEALAARRGRGAKLVLLATSASKANNLAPLLAHAAIVFANRMEWNRLGSAAGDIALAFVTNGAEGASVIERGRILASAPAPPTRIINVIGAGDAFAAGVLDAVLDAAAPERALLRGLEWAKRCVASSSALGWLSGGEHDRAAPNRADPSTTPSRKPTKDSA